MAGHDCPPKAEAVVIVRVLDCFPPPQVLSQADHTPQAEILQSTGHGEVLQATTSLVAEQTFPPLALGTTTARVLIFCPPPHFSLHSLNTDHSAITQSTGHGEVLHDLTSTVASQAGAPKSGSVVTARVR